LRGRESSRTSSVPETPVINQPNSSAEEPSTAIPPFHVDNADEPSVQVRFVTETDKENAPAEPSVEFQGEVRQETIISLPEEVSSSEDDSVSGDGEEVSSEASEDSKSTPKKTARKRRSYLAERGKVYKKGSAKKRRTKKSITSTEPEVPKLGLDTDATPTTPPQTTAPTPAPTPTSEVTGIKRKRDDIEVPREAEVGGKRRKVSSDKFFKSSLPISINGASNVANPISEENDNFGYIGRGMQSMEIDGKTVKIKWSLEAHVVEEDE